MVKYFINTIFFVWAKSRKAINHLATWCQKKTQAKKGAKLPVYLYYVHKCKQYQYKNVQEMTVKSPSRRARAAAIAATAVAPNQAVMFFCSASSQKPFWASDFCLMCGALCFPNISLKQNATCNYFIMSSAFIVIKILI